MGQTNRRSNVCSAKASLSSLLGTVQDESHCPHQEKLPNMYFHVLPGQESSDVSWGGGGDQSEIWLPMYRTGMGQPLEKQASCYDRVLGAILWFRGVPEASHAAVD